MASKSEGNGDCEERKGRIPDFYYLLKTTALHIGLIYVCMLMESTIQQENKRKRRKNNRTISNTPPQVGTYMSYAPSLLQIYLILGPLRDLVKMSTS